MPGKKAGVWLNLLKVVETYLWRIGRVGGWENKVSLIGSLGKSIDFSERLSQRLVTTTGYTDSKICKKEDLLPDRGSD
jgi:hypothetical protein